MKCVTIFYCKAILIYDPVVTMIVTALVRIPPAYKKFNFPCSSTFYAVLGSTVSRLHRRYKTESLISTTKSSGVPGTHLADLRNRKG